MKPGAVYSMRKGAEAPPPDAIRIDRQTRWGNPFILDLDKDTPEERAAILSQYKDHLWTLMKADDQFFMALGQLAGRPLKCWCSPKQCHGDVLAAAAVYAYTTLVEGD